MQAYPGEKQKEREFLRNFVAMVRPEEKPKEPEKCWRILHRSFNSKGCKAMPYNHIAFRALASHVLAYKLGDTSRLPEIRAILNCYYYIPLRLAVRVLAFIGEPFAERD